MDIYSKLAQSIIKQQENIIGPLAIEQAKKVPGLVIESGENVKLTGDQSDVIEQLVERYKELFGQASVEVCKSAAKQYIDDLPKDKIPPMLQS